MIEKNSGKPYMNVIFGNFYSPGYDDPDFVDETMELIKNLGYNSVMFDTKDWEDFRERYKTGERSQYVKMQEYMGQSALKHGLTYNFLVLYLNGDNLYPHIRFSPPVFGEEVVTIDQKGGKWYKYWSDGRACRPDPSNVRGGLYHLPVGTKTGPSNMYDVGSDCSAKF